MCTFKRTLLMITLMLSLTGLSSCGQMPEGQQASELSSQETYYYYCVKTGSQKWFNENGRPIQKMYCSGGGLGASVWAASFGEAQGLAKRECVRRAGAGFALGGAGNFGPGAPGGDVSIDVDRVGAWVQANCYGGS